MDERRRQVFFTVHAELPREAPGSRASTERALAAAQTLPPSPSVLDVACGPGMQTLHLAELLPGASLTAVDRHHPYLRVAAARLQNAGFSDRVALLQADMRALPFRSGSFDLIWCEGAAYIMGVEEALRAWRPLLGSGGRLAFTEAVWLTDQPPAELESWWAADYPALTSVAGTLARAEASGYRVRDHFVLPEADWWEDYYRPMERRIEGLRPTYRDDALAAEVLDECQQEIDYFRRWSACYGYLFVVAERDGG